MTRLADPHVAALACQKYIRGRRGIYAPVAAAEDLDAATVCTAALAPEPLPDDDLTAARARVAAERQERIAHPRASRRITVAELTGIMRGNGWLHIADIRELLRCCGQPISVSMVKRRLLDAVADGLAERRGTNSASVMYRAKENAQGA